MNYKIVSRETFIDNLKEFKNRKQVKLFFDIETYQYNEKEGKKTPSRFKNWVYSVAISYYYYETLHIIVFSNFKDFFDCFDNLYGKKKPNFLLIAHNSNKYDNHYLRKDLIYYYELPFYNQFILTSTKEGNHYSYKLKDLKKSDKEKGCILEKRVKSKINLEMTFYLFGIKFETLDNYIKTHASIKTLGKKLLRLNLLTDKELKTDFNYVKYNKERDLTDLQAEEYAKDIFKSLDKDQLRYIYNDVIILPYSYKYYDKIFKGFDYEKITFTKNILDSYNTNDLTQYQLLKSNGKGKHAININYTDYTFNNSNLYDYLKSFYNGGLNFYNDEYVGKIYNKKVFGMDINSSYPAVMYKNKIPTTFNSWQDFNKETAIEIKDLDNENIYTIYRITRATFDDYIICNIKSRVLKQMLVKYYSKNEYININTYTFKMLRDIIGLDIKKIKVLSYIKFDCVDFASKEQLKEYYKIKTQGKSDIKFNMEDLTNIKETKEKNTVIYSQEEIDIAKLNLNGLYGIPALRPYFNLFRYIGHEYKNIENGFCNSQRNIIFSIFVTSVSVYNLLLPLKYLTQEEIDEGFLYCDTDSLYLDKELSNKISRDIFNPYNIGAWDIQNDEIDKFYILNHKKYAYEEKGKITVKCGGVPNNSFNTNMSFEKFIASQFSEGKEIETLRSIYNEQGTISLYKSKVLLDKGYSYPLYSNDKNFLEKKEKLFNEVKKMEDTGEGVLYIESNIGTFSVSDVYYKEHSTQRNNMKYLKQKEDFLLSLI